MTIPYYFIFIQQFYSDFGIGGVLAGTTSVIIPNRRGSLGHTDIRARVWIHLGTHHLTDEVTHHQDICFKSSKTLLQLKFYNKNFNKYKSLPRLKLFILTQIFTKKTQQIEDFAKRVQDFMRPLYNVVSMELLRVNAEVRTCCHLSCSNSL